MQSLLQISIIIIASYESADPNATMVCESGYILSLFHFYIDFYGGSIKCVFVFILSIFTLRYMDFFPQKKKPNDTILFEKSANYFDSEVVPRRVSALVPRAKIVVLLMNPAKRALSWYYVSVEKKNKQPTCVFLG